MFKLGDQCKPEILAGTLCIKLGGFDKFVLRSRGYR